MSNGTLRLSFADAYGDPLKDTVDVELKHMTLSQSVKKKDHKGTQRLNITQLSSAQGGIFRLLVYPARHRPVGRFVRIQEGKTTSVAIMLPVDPDRVSDVEAPAFSDVSEALGTVLAASDVEGFDGLRGESLYEALDGPRMAGLLNIFGKMAATTFDNETSVASYLTSITRLRGDRLFALVKKELRDHTRNSVTSGLFRTVSGAAHTPPPGYAAVDSYKTRESYGNLQLTFFNRPGMLDFLVDADIDDAQGIGHVFQVLKNLLPGQETNPYDIHEILLAHQKLDPGYRLVI